MKLNYFKQLLSFVLVVTILGMTGCEKNPGEVPQQGEQPTLPPESSMKFDFSFFNTSGDFGLAKTTTISRNNWRAAALRLAGIEIKVLAGAVVPAALLVAAASQQAEWNREDAKYHWIFSINNNGNIFKADLAGWIDVQNQYFVWEMYVTCNTYNPELVDFLFYEGHSKIDNSEGYWVIYYDQTPDMKNECLRIDWTHEEDKHTLDFKRLLDGAANENDELKCLADGSERKINFYDASENTRLEIFWDAITGSGYLITPNYNNGEKACWDENQDDIECP